MTIVVCERMSVSTHKLADPKVSGESDVNLLQDGAGDQFCVICHLQNPYYIIRDLVVSRYLRIERKGIWRWIKQWRIVDVNFPES